MILFYTFNWSEKEKPLKYEAADYKPYSLKACLILFHLLLTIVQIHGTELEEPHALGRCFPVISFLSPGEWNCIYLLFVYIWLYLFS